MHRIMHVITVVSTRRKAQNNQSVISGRPVRRPCHAIPALLLESETVASVPVPARGSPASSYRSHA